MDQDKHKRRYNFQLNAKHLLHQELPHIWPGRMELNKNYDLSKSSSFVNVETGLGDNQNFRLEIEL